VKPSDIAAMMRLMKTQSIIADAEGVTSVRLVYCQALTTKQQWETFFQFVPNLGELVANTLEEVISQRDEARKELSNLSYHHCETMEQHFRVRGWEAPVGGYDL
jgi:hypothetical protein